MDAIVILPDHLYCLWTLPENDYNFSLRWRLIKGAFSRHLENESGETLSSSRRNKREREIWQRRFWEHTIRNQEDFNKHCDYIHYNPVKHGLANSPIDWENSSFRSYVRKGQYSPDWGIQEGKYLLTMNYE
jgi:putative transposase